MLLLPPHFHYWTHYHQSTTLEPINKCNEPFAVLQSSNKSIEMALKKNKQEKCEACHHSIAAMAMAATKTPKPVVANRVPPLGFAVATGVLVDVGNGRGGMLVAPPLLPPAEPDPDPLEVPFVVELKPVR